MQIQHSLNLRVGVSEKSLQIPSFDLGSFLIKFWREIKLWTFDNRILSYCLEAPEKIFVIWYICMIFPIKSCPSKNRHFLWNNRGKQDPASTKQKTGWTIHSFPWSYLVWKRVSLWMWSLGGSQHPFSCVLGHFRRGDDQTNEQPGDPSASLLLTSEKAVFCNNQWLWQLLSEKAMKNTF